MATVAAEEGLIPFTFLEEFWRQCEQPREPGTVHFELRVQGTIDEERLRTAFQATVAAHPMTRAARWDGSKRGAARWRLVELDRLSLDNAVRVTRCDSEHALAVERAQFFSTFIDIRDAPGFRLLLAHRPRGDSLLLSVNHALCDGVGATRFLQSLGRAYAGVPDPIPEIDVIAARYLKTARFTSSQPLPPRPVRIKAFSAATVAADGADIDEPCYGFQHITLPALVTASLDPRRLVSNATMNDLLLGALLRTVADWNRRHGVGQANYVIHAPFNLRPASWSNEVVANLAISCSVGATSEQITNDEATLETVVAQTQWFKAGGAGALLRLPNWALRVAVHAMPRLTHSLRPTAVLTNQGRVEQPPDFGPAGVATEFWNSGGLGMPTGLLIGADTLHGRLMLCMCYRHALFGEWTARQFADLYVEHLLTLGTGNATRPMPYEPSLLMKVPAIESLGG